MVGTRTGGLHVTPSAERATRRRLETQLAVGAQSDEATYTAPSGPASADGSGATRSPETGWYEARATAVGGSQVSPPSTDRNTEICVLSK